nr:hypothetical protein [uncultured Butyrivibrio sp.]
MEDDVSFFSMFIKYLSARKNDEYNIKKAASFIAEKNYMYEGAAKYGYSLSDCYDMDLKTYELCAAKSNLIDSCKMTANMYSAPLALQLRAIKMLDNDLGGGYTEDKLVKRVYVDKVLQQAFTMKNRTYTSFTGSDEMIPLPGKDEFRAFVHMIEAVDLCIESKKPTISEKGFLLDQHSNLLEKDLFNGFEDKLELNKKAMDEANKYPQKRMCESFEAGNATLDDVRECNVNQAILAAKIFFEDAKSNLVLRPAFSVKGALCYEDMKHVCGDSYMPETFKKECVEKAPEEMKQIVADYIDVSVYLWSLFPNEYNAFDQSGKVKMKDGRLL